MAVLIALAVGLGLVAAGCYAPRLRDCTVACDGAADCGDGQVCGADGLCASPELAGQCDDDPGGPPPRPDAGAPRDGFLGGELTIKIEDKGRVELDGVAVCDSEIDERGECTLVVALGDPLELRALPHEDRVFERWTTPVCAGEAAVCTVVPALPLTHVGVKFKRADD